jgi:hypothetical protein
MLHSSCMALSAWSNQAFLCSVRKSAPGCLVMRMGL